MLDLLISERILRLRVKQKETIGSTFEVDVKIFFIS